MYAIVVRCYPTWYILECYSLWVHVKASLRALFNSLQFCFHVINSFGFSLILFPFPYLAPEIFCFLCIMGLYSSSTGIVFFRYFWRSKIYGKNQTIPARRRYCLILPVYFEYSSFRHYFLFISSRGCKSKIWNNF